MATAGVQFYLGVHNAGALSNSIVGVMAIVSRDLAYHAIDAHNGALDREPLSYGRVQQNNVQSCGDRVRDCNVSRQSGRTPSASSQDSSRKTQAGKLTNCPIGFLKLDANWPMMQARWPDRPMN